MCIPAVLTAIGTAVGSTTAAGAAAGAATAGSGLASIGTALAIGGSLFQGIQTYQSSKAQAAALEQQAVNERNLAAVKEQRGRAQFRSAMRKQMAELAARGIAMDSPTAVLLGQTAAQEMAFEGQAIRSEGAARGIELGADARIARGRATSGLLRGTFGAADAFLTGAPKIWPELLS